MKLNLLLLIIISIVGFSLADESNTIDNNNNECQIYYSIIGRNDENCGENVNSPSESFSYAKLENGYIVEM